jgi:hypothetical protein
VGVYADTMREHGRAPRLVGTSPPAAVVAAVLSAIKRDRPEVIVTPRPIRMMLMLSALWPRASEWLLRRLGIHQSFEATARAIGRHRSGPR